jgi:hypothetical protein
MECKTSSEATQSYGNMVIGHSPTNSGSGLGFRFLVSGFWGGAASFRGTETVSRKDVQGLPDISHAG